MKLMFFGVLLSIGLTNNSAMAQGSPWDADAQQEVGLQIVRAAHLQAEGNAFKEIGQVTIKVGEGIAAVGASVLVVDVGLYLAGVVDISMGVGYISNGLLVAAGSGVVIGGGGTIVLIGGAVYGLGKMMVPTETANDQIDDYFLSSKDAFNEFLDGSIEQQRDLIKTNKRMRVAVLGLAAAIVEQSQNLTTN